MDVYVCHISFFNSKFGQERTFLRIWDNRMEINAPVSPFACLTTNDQCVNDRVSVAYFDRAPFRSAYLCGILPLTFFGPPVIFVEKPLCCGQDLTPYYGAQLRASPCNCFDLKTYLVW
jgi:hypothetical protein